MARLICGENGSALFCDSGKTIVKEHGEKKKQTNADRIRSMSDEELAEFLSEVKYDGIYHKEGQEYPMIPEVWKYWLQSEVEEHHGNEK